MHHAAGSQLHKEIFMKTSLKKMAMAAAVMLAVTVIAASANAACGIGKPQVRPQSWNQDGMSSSLLKMVNSGDEPITGLWKVDFIASGNPAPGPPDGTVLDHAYVQWHNDGTEIMNSGRNPETQSFCLGVWKKVGHHHYKLNHVAVSWDQTVDTQNPQGPANIREDVVLGPAGNHFSGSFVLVQYDQAGNVLFQATGKLKGTRITPNSPPSVLFEN
jgi:hypothetical protein